MHHYLVQQQLLHANIVRLKTADARKAQQAFTPANHQGHCHKQTVKDQAMAVQTTDRMAMETTKATLCSNAHCAGAAAHTARAVPCEVWWQTSEIARGPMLPCP